MKRQSVPGGKTAKQLLTTGSHYSCVKHTNAERIDIPPDRLYQVAKCEDFPTSCTLKLNTVRILPRTYTVTCHECRHCRLCTG